ncbi:MAG: ChaN family lipoprotein [Gemmatimonadales bacterium]|nr:ChaN family lipoprotein [Gemmatimonadales bacterium]
MAPRDGTPWRGGTKGSFTSENAHWRALVPASLLLAGCGGTPSAAPATAAAPLEPIVDVATGNVIGRDALVRRLAAADIVLLGEVHDNAVHHELRAELIAAAARDGRRLAIVYEQFPWGRDSALATRPADPIEPWLDAAGFDREGWRWPLHRPVVLAATERDLPRYGSQLPREVLRPMMRGGAAPAPLGDYMARAPLAGEGLAALDRTLLDGHCGQLPPEMVPMLRGAQEARDAAMTDAVIRARQDGRAAWLIAGNGHVRRDFGVPRMLAVLAPGARVVTVGFLERGADGAAPAADEMRVYDVVWQTPRAERDDPCKAFGR